MSDITELLRAAEQGDADASSRLFDRIYDDLKRLAARRLASERDGHTLQPTALVNEVYLRLLGGTSKQPDAMQQFSGSKHFFASAAEAMRRILVESARSKRRQKRGGEFRRADIEPDQLAAPEMADKLLALNEALTRLAAVEPQLAELVTLRYFGGLTLKEAATQLGIARRTADAQWAYSRAWLLAEMKSE